MADDGVVLLVGVAGEKAVAGTGLDCGGSTECLLGVTGSLLCVLCSNMLSIEKDDLLALIVLLLLAMLDDHTAQYSK